MRTDLGTTIIGQTLFQEHIVRESASAQGWGVEFHRVETTAGGVGTITTKMAKVVAAFCGIDGTAAATAAAVDFDGQTYDSTADSWSYPVAGANSTAYTIMIVGSWVGH